jgi:competence ComEA-like helix-hairpin-helix protein
MKPFFLLVLLGLSACAPLSDAFEIESPSQAMITVSIQYPDGDRQTRTIPNFSRLETIWTDLQCATCDLRHLNPDQILKDGDVIVLRPKAGLTVSLNQATLADLMFLPGIGEVLAQRIIDYRMLHGFFKRIEEVMLVRGIKEGLFRKIKPFLVL